MYLHKPESTRRLDGQFQPPSVSVIVPIYNERENIQLLYESILAMLSRLGRPHEIVFVDDGSTDGSTGILQRLAQRDRRVKLVSFCGNFGQTAALQAGLDHAGGDYVVAMDGDLQNDPLDIPMMLEKLDDGYDLVHGWRRNRQDALLNRKIPSKVANWIISRATHFPVHDLGCTLKAMRRATARRLRLFGEMHRFIPILAHAQGARCVEVVTRHHPRKFGQTKYGIGRTVRVVLDLITVNFLIRYLASPMKLFGRAGMLCLVAGMVSGLVAIGQYAAGNVSVLGGPLLVCMALLMLSGLHFIGLGLLGELGARIYFECQARPAYEVRSLINFEHATIGPSDALSRAA